MNVILSGKRKRRIISEINVTPLTDVALVLLVIFMVAAPLITQSGFTVKLPKAATATLQPNSPFIVSITPDEKIFFVGKEIPKESLGNVLKMRLQQSVEKVIVIQADKATKHGVVVDVMDIAKAAGAAHLAIAIEIKK